MKTLLASGAEACLSPQLETYTDGAAGIIAQFDSPQDGQNYVDAVLTRNGIDRNNLRLAYESVEALFNELLEDADAA